MSKDMNGTETVTERVQVQTHPGRVRIVSPRLKGNDMFLYRIRQILESTGGLRTVRANSSVGSLTIRYQRPMSRSEILTLLANHAVLDSKYRPEQNPMRLDLKLGAR